MAVLVEDFGRARLIIGRTRTAAVIDTSGQGGRQLVELGRI